MSRFIDRALDALAGTLPSPGVPPHCDRCDAWHPPDEPCGPIRHALDVLDPERPEAPVDERKPCPVCRDRFLRHPDDSLCTTCAHRVLARQVLGMPFAPEDARIWDGVRDRVNAYLLDQHGHVDTAQRLALMIVANQVTTIALGERVEADHG